MDQVNQHQHLNCQVNQEDHVDHVHLSLLEDQIDLDNHQYRVDQERNGPLHLKQNHNDINIKKKLNFIIVLTFWTWFTFSSAITYNKSIDFIIRILSF